MIIFYRFFIVIFFALIATSSIATATVPLGISYTDNQFKEINDRALRGDKDSQAKLAYAYRYQFMVGSKSIGPDHDKQLYWLIKAANNGSPWAQTGMGYLYQKGDFYKRKGFEKDLSKAYAWYEKAANQQYPAAQDMIGKMYRDGLGVKKNTLTAAIWFQKSADQLFSEGALDLAILYLKGDVDFPQNYEKAFFWADIWENKNWPQSGFANDFAHEEDQIHVYPESIKHLSEEQIQKVKKAVMAWEPPAK